MPLEFRTLGMKTNTEASFSFSGAVQKYFVGLSNFFYYYKNSDNHVLDFDLAIDSSKTASNTVHVKLRDVLVDGGNRTIDDDNSAVYVTVVAWTGANQDALVMAPVSGIANGARSPVITLPASNPRLFCAALSGFQLNYPGTKDHHVKIVNAGTSAEVDVLSGYVVGQSNMTDGSHSATDTTVDGVFLATGDQDLGICTMIKRVQSTGLVTVDFSSVLGGKKLTSSAVLIQDYNIQFANNQNNHIRGIGSGCMNWLTYDTSVVLSAPQSRMYDDGNRCQDNNLSYVTVLVIGSTA